MRLQRTAIGCHRPARRLGERYQAFAPALATHKDQRLTALRSGLGQRNELRDAQPRRIEQFEQADRAQRTDALGGFFRRLGGGRVGGGEEPLNLFDRKDFRQGRGAGADLRGSRPGSSPRRPSA